MFIRVALIHSSARVVPLLSGVACEVMADVDLVHIVDEGIERMLEQAGALTEPVTRRLCSHAMNAQESGAEGVILTCPVVGFALDPVRAAVRIPALRMGQAMAETAVRFGTSIGVLAERPLSLDPTLALLRERADAQGRTVVFESRLAEDAARALQNDDLGAYDQAVIRGVEQLAKNDIIVLADVMMHRAAHAAGERVAVPVLSSPEYGFEQMAKALNYFRR